MGVEGDVLKGELIVLGIVGCFSRSELEILPTGIVAVFSTQICFGGSTRICFGVV